jgi:hypothetical protein
VYIYIYIRTCVYMCVYIYIYIYVHMVFTNYNVMGLNTWPNVLPIIPRLIVSITLRHCPIVNYAQIN